MKQVALSKPSSEFGHQPTSFKLWYGRSPIGQALLFACLLFALFLVRRPFSFAHAQFWAEDGAIFFADQVNHGFWKSLVTPYAGYLHLTPRLVAATVSTLPVRWIPLYYCLVSMAIAAICCSAFSWPCFRRILPSDLLRAACCLVMATAIPIDNELLGTLCNIQWFLSVLMILLIAADIPGAQAESWLTASQVLIAFTAPATLVYLPFLVWQCVRKPEWRKIRPSLTILVLVIQVLIIRHSHDAVARPNLNFNSVFLSTIASGLSRIVLPCLIGRSFLTADSERALIVKLLVALIASACLLTLLILKLPKARRFYLLSAAYIAIGSLAFAMAGRNLAASFLDMDGLRHLPSVRYYCIPCSMFVFIAALFLDFLFSHRTVSRISAWPGLVLLLLFSRGIARNLRATPLVDLSWPRYAAQIQAWEQAEKHHVLVQPLTIPINPPPVSLTLQPRDLQ